MNALAEVTAASPVITEYYQTLLEKAPDPIKEELVSLAYLLIGTLGVDERKAAFVCVDRTARVFAPLILEVGSMPDRAQALRRLKPVTCEASAEQAMDTIPPEWAWPPREGGKASPAYSAWDACWSLTKPINEDIHLTEAAWRTAEAAAGAKDFAGGIQLFKDLCAMLRD